jgi:hypothetical protein
MNNMELNKLLMDIARKYQYLPEGKEKDEIWQLILRIAEILYGNMNIEEINFDEE